MSLLGEAVQVPPHTRFRRHEHDQGHLCVVLAGGLMERIGRSWVTAEPGTVRVSRHGRHDIDFGPAGARCLVIEVSDAGMLRWPAGHRFLEPDPWLARLVNRIDRDLDRRDPSHDVVLDGVAVELVAQVARRLNGRRLPPPAWLDDARAMIHDTPEPLSVSALAARLGVHRVHLARVFREHFGTSITGLMRRVRLERAHRLLARGELPLAEIAATVGFADQSHLTRATRTAFGRTPGDLRRTLRPFKTSAGTPG